MEPQVGDLHAVLVLPVSFRDTPWSLHLSLAQSTKIRTLPQKVPHEHGWPVKEGPDQARVVRLNAEMFPVADTERRLLSRHGVRPVGAAELIEQVGRKHPRHEVARDDIVDALAAAVTARMAQGDYRTLPENVETDQEGLRMEMVYTQ
jgi:hypothetical protein